MHYTALYKMHQQAGGKLVDFAGWQMPLHYGSQTHEHHRVRTDSGMFDVSHMGVIDLHGGGARAFLQHLLANDVAKLRLAGQALYSCMLDENAGILDDLIVYILGPDCYRLVVNAATTEKGLAWMKAQQGGCDIEISLRDDLSILAVQGPQACDRLGSVMDHQVRQLLTALRRFSATQTGDYLIARTGYTGEDGFEVILPSDQIVSLWLALLDVGVQPCGLGSRDSLRLEAGMHLYGLDMDQSTSPLVSGLAQTVDWSARDFIGRAALITQQDRGVDRRFVGVLLNERVIMRPQQKITTVEGEGYLTSGGFSPTLGCSIGLARLPAGDSQWGEVKVRGQWHKVRLVKPPFVTKGKARY